MDVSSALSLIVHVLLMPPTCLLIVALGGWLLRRRWPRSGRAMTVLSLAALLVLSSNGGALLLVRPLENMTAPLYHPRTAGAQAIVVLGAASVERAPEYEGMDIADPVALVRMQYGAHLQHATGLPLLVTGGPQSRKPGAVPVAVTMARVLREDFRTPVRWVEAQARNTAQNAAYSARMLKAAKVRRVLLVTHAMHMPRSRAAFLREGIDVVEAPTAFYSRAPLRPMMLLPSGSGLYRAFYATHEWVGLLWYRLQALDREGTTGTTPSARNSST